MKKTAYLITSLLILANISFVGRSFAATNSELYFTPSDEITLVKGCPGIINLKLNTHGEKVLASDTTFTVNGDVSIDNVVIGSILPMQTYNQIDGSKIKLSAGRFPSTGTFDGDGTIGSITITPDLSADSVSLTFFGDIFVDNNVINEDIENTLYQTIDTTYNVQERYNTDINEGYCNPDISAPVFNLIDPNQNSYNNAINTNVIFALSDNRSGVDISTLSFKVNNKTESDYTIEENAGIYKVTVNPAEDFDMGTNIEVTISNICDNDGNCLKNSTRTFRTVPAPSCGDGKIDAGEECDDGSSNSNINSCTSSCSIAFCGDGYYHWGEEECDDGNSVDNDGCSSECKLEAPTQIECPEIICEDCKNEIICEDTAEEPAEEPKFEPEIAPPAPAIHYSALEIQDIALEVIKEEEAIEETAATIALPLTEAHVKTRIEECIEEFPALDFNTSGVDFDNDGLSNKTECYAFTNPELEDTDADGCLDGDEINIFASDPLDGSDCQIEEKLKTVSISSPQAGWLIADLEITGVTSDETSIVNLLAFPVIAGKTQIFNSINLGSTSKFDPSGIEGHYYFEYNSDVKLDDGKDYDLMAISILQDGKTIISDPIRFSLDSRVTVSSPEIISLGNMNLDNSIKLRDIIIKSSDDGKVEVQGNTEYGTQVFAVWKSVVLASSVIADSELGHFSIKSPRPLDVNEDHHVTLYAVKYNDNQKVKSKSIQVDFHINKTSIYLYIITFALLLIITALAIYGFVIKKRW